MLMKEYKVKTYLLMKEYKVKTYIKYHISLIMSSTCSIIFVLKKTSHWCNFALQDHNKTLLNYL